MYLQKYGLNTKTYLKIKIVKKMKNLDPTFISLCNYAIPSNDILNEGLGDLLLQKMSSEIQLLKKELFIKYEEVICLIKKILSENEGVALFTYSDITDQLISLIGKKNFFPFYKDFNIFCAQAYFSNSKVLDAYGLLLTSKQKTDILSQEVDNFIFSELTNK